MCTQQLTSTKGHILIDSPHNHCFPSVPASKHSLHSTPPPPKSQPTRPSQQDLSAFHAQSPHPTAGASCAAAGSQAAGGGRHCRSPGGSKPHTQPHTAPGFGWRQLEPVVHHSHHHGEPLKRQQRATQAAGLLIPTVGHVVQICRCQFPD